MAAGIINTVKHWWVFLLRGLLFVLTGIYMFSFPIVSFAVIGLMVGLIIITGGIIEVVHAYINRYIMGASWRFLLGLVDIALGLFLTLDLKVSIAILPIIMGTWFLFKGFSLFSFAAVVRNSAWVVFNGIITTLFGIMVLIDPVFGVMTIVLWIAFAFFFTGIANIILSVRLLTAKEILTKS